MKKTVFTLIFLMLFLVGAAQDRIIPIPVEYTPVNEEFTVGNKLKVVVINGNEQVNTYTNQLVTYLTNVGIECTLTKTKSANDAGNAVIITILSNQNSRLGEEGYELEVSQQNIQLSANQAAGIFNGIQTLKQLLPPAFEAQQKIEIKNINITGCKIVDYPRFGWRGLMLDVSRHFFTVDEVKAFIDKMADYKLNVFHWHLTDDEGWRIEIKSLPKLTAVGAWRVERHGRFGDTRPYPKDGEKATYGGFYTQEQIRDVIRYASERNITIVPEIDMPGHSMAALAAYPELSVKKEPKFVNPGSKFSEWYGNHQFKMLIENTLNPADEKVYEFVDKVFTEVAELFPGEFIHMGGDECYHGYWEEDPGVQQFMKKNKIQNGGELQSYFVKRVNKIINSKGKKLIGWDEILEGGLAEGAAVMSWRGMDGGIQAARLGHEVVMSPTDYAYLDYTQGDLSVENRIYASLSLEKVYSFEPVPEEVDRDLILGGQGNLWTEVIPTLQYAFYMTYPRAFAIAETFWSPGEKKNWGNFLERTEQHFERFAAADVNIAKTILEPEVKVFEEDGKIKCALTAAANGIDIYYSIDNTYPVQFAEKYSEPFEIPQGNLSLRTQSFRGQTPVGRELIIPRAELVKRAGR